MRFPEIFLGETEQLPPNARAHRPTTGEVVNKIIYEMGVGRGVYYLIHRIPELLATPDGVTAHATLHDAISASGCEDEGVRVLLADSAAGKYPNSNLLFVLDEHTH